MNDKAMNGNEEMSVRKNGSNLVVFVRGRCPNSNLSRVGGSSRSSTWTYSAVPVTSASDVNGIYISFSRRDPSNEHKSMPLFGPVTYLIVSGGIRSWIALVTPCKGRRENENGLSGSQQPRVSWASGTDMERAAIHAAMPRVAHEVKLTLESSKSAMLL